MTTTSLSEIFQKRLWNILEVKNFKIRAECMSWYLKRCKTLIGICYLSTFKIGSFWICFHRQTNTRWLIHIFNFEGNSHPPSLMTRQTPIWAFYHFSCFNIQPLLLHKRLAFIQKSFYMYRKHIFWLAHYRFNINKYMWVFLKF